MDAPVRSGGAAGPKGQSLDAGRAARDEIGRRVNALIAELDAVSAR